jgi:hypothetical protein
MEQLSLFPELEGVKFLTDPFSIENSNKTSAVIEQYLDNLLSKQQPKNHECWTDEFKPPIPIEKEIMNVKNELGWARIIEKWLKIRQIVPISLDEWLAKNYKFPDEINLIIGSITAINNGVNFENTTLGNLLKD